MSRCFPYPPPGYAGKCASNEALIWTIKLQRESEKPKSEKKKDKRKEKKEKKREGKGNGTISSEKKENKRDDKSNGTISNCQKLLTDDGKQSGKQQESSYERMEQSGITEEHGRPCSSSDSTENSGKRKRQSPTPSGNNAPRNPGTVIRIVLNSRKKEDGPTLSNNIAPVLQRVDTVPQKADLGVKSSGLNLHITPPKSSSGSQKAIGVKNSALNLHITPPKSNSGSLSQKANAVVKSSAPKLHVVPPKINATQARINTNKDNAVVISSTPKLHVAPPKVNASQYLINSSNKDKPLPLPISTRASAMEVETASTSKDENKLPRPLRKYKALFENWVPPSMEIETVTEDDEDWLFGSSKERQAEKRIKCCKEEVPSYTPALHQPRAQFISEADIYALPFTVPF